MKKKGLRGVENEYQPIIEKYAKRSLLDQIKEAKEDVEKGFQQPFDEEELFQRKYTQSVQGFTKILEKFQSGNVDEFKGYLYDYNRNSRAMYEEIYSVKLPKTQQGVNEFLKSQYPEYYTKIEADRKKLEAEKKDEEKRAIEKRKADNPYIDYAKLTPFEIGRLDKSLDVRFNWSYGIGIKSLRQVINEGHFDRKYQYETDAYKNLKYDAWRYYQDSQYAREVDRKMKEQKTIYNLGYKGKESFTEVPKIVYDAVDFSRITSKSEGLIKLKVLAAKAKLKLAML